MNETELYQKLVDLYAGRELSAELESEFESVAAREPALKREAQSLRRTVDLLHTEPAPEFTEESHQRILMKLYARGVEMQRQERDPLHLQYQLPMHG